MSTSQSLITPQRNISNHKKIVIVDYAKGIGIFLVVVGHTLVGLINASIIPPSTLTEFVQKFIYSFHMPLFFIISGLFIERSLRKPVKQFLINKLQVIVYPYIVWSVLQRSLQIFASNYINHKGVSFIDILKIPYKPIMQFWFLHTLLLIIISYVVWRKLFQFSSISFFVFSVVIYCLHVFNVSFGPWGALYLFRRHAIYFALGVMVGISRLLEKLEFFKGLWLIFTAVGGFSIVALSVIFLPIENGWIVPLIGILGIGASISLAILISRYQFTQFIKNWGLFSLEIFVAHSISSSLVRTSLQQVFQISEPITHLIIGIIAGIYIPILLDRFCRKIGFNYLFTLRDRTA